MRALMVYESMFGNARDVATTIAEGLARRCEIELAEISAAPSVPGRNVDLLIVGGPTLALGIGRPQTRSDADGTTASIVTRNIGLREWIANLPMTPSHMAAATFDTRVRVRGLPGSAARGAARRLRQRGYRVLDRPETFYVTEVSGPLVVGELVRARAWGHRIGVDLVNGKRLGPTTAV
ncbi:MAG TPA: hypothetical protein VEX15_12550 [Nocardioidaceae bacterium]|nr:hypothetical protein [Nocardioidaceae bacterium]